MNERTERLRNLMARHGLKAADVANLLGRKPNTVRVWRVADGDRVIPADTLALLELLLDKREARN